MSKIIGNTVGTPISPKKVVEKADLDTKTIQLIDLAEFDYYENPVWTWESGIYQLQSSGSEWLDLDLSGKYIASDGMVIIADVPSCEFKAIYSFCFDASYYEQNLIALIVDSEGTIQGEGMSAGKFISDRLEALESAVAELALMGD